MSAALRRVVGAVCLGLIFGFGSGCAILDKNFFALPAEGAQSVNHIEMAFAQDIFPVDDSINPGVTVPCLKGRVYFMGADGGRPIGAHGWLLAELFDTTTQTPNVAPRRLAQWDFKPEVLKQIESPDKIGIGYTMFLPFSEYNPSIKKVLLRVVYVNEKGEARENHSTLMLRMAREEPFVQIQNFRNVPATYLQTR